MSYYPQNDPADLILHAAIAGSTTAFVLGDSFAGVAECKFPFAVVQDAVTLSPVDPDDQQIQAECAQWNLNKLIANTWEDKPIPPIQKILFPCAGTQWKNTIQISLGGVTYNDFQLSYRDNRNCVLINNNTDSDKNTPNNDGFGKNNALFGSRSFF